MPEIPEDAKAPQDHKKKKSQAARQAEADGYVDIEQCGVQLRIPIGGKVPLRAYMAFRNDDELGGTEALLGPEQWSAFMAADPTVEDFAEIGQKLNDLLGKLTSLIGLLEDYGDEVEADLARFYRLNLVDFYRGEIPPRRLSVLIRHLPHDSALVTALGNGQPAWTTTDHLLADLWRLTLKVHSDPKRDVPDHPARAEMTARAKSTAKKALRTLFLQRKKKYEGGV